MTDQKKGPAPENRGEATNNAGERSTKHIKLRPASVPPPRNAPPFEHPFPGRLSIGDSVNLKHFSGNFEVVAMDDPALLTLRAPSGATLKAGWRTIIGRAQGEHP